jgi:hypothetical protein
VNGAAAGLALLFFLPIGVICGWIAREAGGRLDARYPVSQPWVPEFDELEPVRESRWEDSERCDDRPERRELPAPVTVNNYFVTSGAVWPSQPPVVQSVPATRELLP